LRLVGVGSTGAAGSEGAVLSDVASEMIAQISFDLAAKSANPADKTKSADDGVKSAALAAVRTDPLTPLRCRKGPSNLLFSLFQQAYLSIRSL